MSILLALGAAVSWGSGDYLGGVASRRQSEITITASAQMVGLVGIGLASIAIGGSPTVADIIVLGFAGIASALGLVALYKALASGHMSVAATITGVWSAALPALWGLVRGDDAGVLIWSGLAIAVAAIAMISWSSSTSPKATMPLAKVVVLAIVAGTMFGVFIIGLDNTSEDAGLWPIFAGRCASVPFLMALARSRGVPSIAVTDRSRVVGAGVLDATANAFVLLALDGGSLAVTGVLSSLYPAATVFWARVIDDERLQTIQHLGLVVAAVAVVMIALG